MHEAPPSLWRACVNHAINTAYFVNPKNWFKIMILPQGTLQCRISEIQELWGESLDLEIMALSQKFLSLIPGLWTQWTICLDFIEVWTRPSKDKTQTFLKQSTPVSCAVLHKLNFTGKKEKKSLKPASLAALPVAKQYSSFWFHLLSNFSSQTAWNRKKRRLRWLVFVSLRIFPVKQWRSGWPENFKKSHYL